MERTNVEKCELYLGKYNLIGEKAPFSFKLDRQHDKAYIVKYNPDDCDKRTIEIPSFASYKYDSMNKVFKGTEQSLKVINHSDITDMTHFFSGFAGEELDLSDFDASKVTNMYRMFSDCDFRHVILDNFDTSNVTNMESMFEGCREIKELDLSSFDTSRVTNMAGMFNMCSDLCKVNLSSFDTSSVTNMEYMFANCGDLNRLDLSNFDTREVIDMSEMFSNAGLLEIDLSSFKTPNLLYMYNMFHECYEIRKINMENFDTSSIDDKYTDLGVFSWCNKLDKLVSKDHIILREYGNA